MLILKNWQVKPYLAVTFLLIVFLVPLQRFKAQENSSGLEAGTLAEDGDGFEMVYVPSATTQMGISRERLRSLIQQGVFGKAAQSDVKERDFLLNAAEDEGVLETIEVTVPAFWIDRYEVTIEQYKSRTEYCIGTGRCSAIDLVNPPELTADPHQPQVSVSWFDAMRFCIGRGARLPTEAEWEYAARGPENFAFPWGNTMVLENLSTNNTTYRVGSRPNNISWVGAYDLAGNAGEWVEDRMKPYINSQSQTFLTQNQSDVNRVVRGGSFRTTIFDMTSFVREGYNPDSQGQIGFRCARSTDPKA